jgi:hypothetical protein
VTSASEGERNSKGRWKMGGRRRALLIGILGLAVGGCATGGSARMEDAAAVAVVREAIETNAAERRATDFASLVVENGSGHPVAVRLDNRRIGTATPGRTCIRIPQIIGEMHLRFVAIGTSGYEAPIVFLEESRHWQVVLRPGVTIKYDVLSLSPRRTSCVE